ncbi:MAG: hypothetical protein U1F68_02940 [Gammaproteobacteria bacterium]
MTAAKQFLLWFAAALALILAAVALHRYAIPLSVTQPIWWVWAVIETVLQCVAFTVGVMHWRELNLGLRVLTVLAGIVALHAVFGLCVAVGYYWVYG